MIAIVSICIGSDVKKVEMTALQVKACCAAMKDFTDTESTSDLNHFTVEVSEENDSYEVVFIPDQVSDEPTVLGGKTKYGREVNYIISKSTLEIKRKSFAR
jgi:hypothetical protein